MIDNYKRLCARFYDIAYPSPPPDEFAFYRDILREVDGPILEPMCGSGRFVVPLLEHGCDIYGFDGSVDMIEACRNRLDGDERIRLATFESFHSPNAFQASSFQPDHSAFSQLQAQPNKRWHVYAELWCPRGSVT